VSAKAGAQVGARARAPRCAQRPTDEHGVAHDLDRPAHRVIHGQAGEALAKDSDRRRLDVNRVHIQEDQAGGASSSGRDALAHACAHASTTSPHPQPAYSSLAPECRSRRSSMIAADLGVRA
jgi:hypothetical protein